MPVRRPAGSALALIPLVCRGEALGVLEVLGTQAAVEEHQETITAIASQSAIVLGNIRRWVDLERALGAIGDSASLAQNLLKATSREEAVKQVVRFCWRRFDAPTVGLLKASGERNFAFVGSRGFGTRRRKELTAAFGPASAAGAPALDQDDILARLRDLFGPADILVADARDALVLVMGIPASSRQALDVVAAILADMLDHLALVTWATKRNESLDSGLAWTAHELRAPLLGIEKAIEQLLRSPNESDPDRELLRFAQNDLRLLASTVDGLLRWSVGAVSLHRRRTDLVRLVREVARSCALEAGGGPVDVRALGEVTARVDPTLLRVAIANIVRNSLAYSGTQVELVVARENGEATVTVKDRGPGIAPDEREAIFDPFVRGRSTLGSSGHGLGLFIAQRAVQAHGGSIWLESSRRGSTFHVRLPARVAW